MKENQQVEWKSSWRDDYLRWICGFANAEGGRLVIGRDDQGVAVGVVVGSLAHVLVQLGPLRQIGFRYRPAVDLADSEARDALKLMAPRALGLGASQLTFLVATALLSSFPSGTITAFRLAFTLFQIPFGVIGVPIGVVVLPSLSRELALGAVDRYLSLLVRAMRDPNVNPRNVNCETPYCWRRFASRQ